MQRVKQGEVFLANVAPRIGFETDLASGRQLVVVAQGNALNSVLESVLVVPLIPAARNTPRYVLDVPVPGAEISTTREHVAPAHLLRPLAISRLEPGPIGKLSPATLAKLLTAVRRLFQ